MNEHMTQNVKVKQNKDTTAAATEYESEDLSDYD